MQAILRVLRRAIVTVATTTKKNVVRGRDMFRSIAHVKKHGAGQITFAVGIKDLQVVGNLET